MKLAIPALTAIAIAALAGCDREAGTATHSTTVVKEPSSPAVVQKEKETVVKEPAAPSSSTTIVQPSSPAPSSSTSVNVDATSKPAESTTEKSTTTSRVDTPVGTATKTETTRTTTK